MEWRVEEIKILKVSISQRMSHKKIGIILGRSTKSVESKASRLGFRYPSRWSLSEIEVLKKYYPSEGSLVADRLPGHSPKSVRYKAMILNIRCRKKKYIDETGNIHGELTVLKKVPTPAGKHIAMWLCECSCGKERIVSGHRLRRGDISSCGQHSKSKLQSFYDVYKRNAAKRDISWNLSINDFHSVTQQCCHYCGCPPDHDYRNGYIGNGIDRINSNSDYSIGNVVSCCTICNRAKTNLSFEEFIEWGKRLGRYLSEHFSG